MGTLILKRASASGSSGQWSDRIVLLPAGLAVSLDQSTLYGLCAINVIRFGLDGMR
jgi:hypothetical protein